MPFIIVREDLTRMSVAAIVNAANTELQRGGGVCGAIFRAADGVALQEACNRLAPIQTGEAVITPGFGLPARHIIHAAGPVYDHKNRVQSEQLLRASYINAMKRAIENRCESIAFPLISSGIYGYPKAEALKVATSAIRDFLRDHDLTVFLAIFDKASFVISSELLGSVESYIDEHYIDTHLDLAESGRPLPAPRSKASAARPLLHEEKAQPLSYFLSGMDEPFSRTLLGLIDAKGMTDVEVYKRANLDRKLFSKIRNNPDYLPSKRTALALAIALKLSLSETEDLLRRAGLLFPIRSNLM